jgi:hypothetical protein
MLYKFLILFLTKVMFEIFASEYELKTAYTLHFFQCDVCNYIFFCLVAFIVTCCSVFAVLTLYLFSYIQHIVSHKVQLYLPAASKLHL